MVALIPSSVATLPYFFKANESKSPAIKCLLTKCEAISKLAVNSAFCKFNKWMNVIQKEHWKFHVSTGAWLHAASSCSLNFFEGTNFHPVSSSHATSKWPIEAIASLKQVSVKRGLRSANSRLSVKRLRSSFCILHPACVLLIVCSLHFIPGPQSAFYTYHLSNSPRKQLDTHRPSVLNIYMGKPEIPVENNKMVRDVPFEKLHKKGSVNWGNAIFLLFLVCSAYLDIHCSGSFFPPRQIL